MSPGSKTYARIRGVLAFMIGIFGSLAILGVFFKIMKMDGYVLFMQIGFIGEAGAFIVMGVLELISGFMDHSGDSSQASRARDHRLPSNFSATLDAKLDARLDDVLTDLAGDVEQFRREMNSLSAELAHSAGAVRQMRAQLESVASADLAGDAQRLGHGMAQLGAEMAGAGTTVEAMRADLEIMLQRFRGFNSLQHSDGSLAHRGRRAS